MSQPNLRTDEEILSEIRAKYEHYLKWANKYKAMLDAAESVNLLNSSSQDAAVQAVSKLDVLSEPVETFYTNSAKSPNTEYFILEILKDGMPRRTKELMDEYIKLAKPDQMPILKDFSARIIGISKRTGKFKNVELHEYKRPFTFWWGLAEWFNGEQLKSEYVNKIREKMNKMHLFE